MEKKVIIIIPAFNEAKSIKRVLLDIKRYHPEIPALVVDDGSKDRTAEIASEAGAMTVSLPYNLGIGGAVQTGFQIANLEGCVAAVQIDADAQHDPKYLKNILTPVLNGDLDLCIGSRFLSNRSGFQSTVMRRLGIAFFSTLIQILTGMKLTDPTSGFRAYGQKLIQEFSTYYPNDYPEPEAVKIAQRIGAKIGEVPVKMRKRLGGLSSIRYLKTIYYMIKVTFALLVDALKSKKRSLACM